MEFEKAQLTISEFKIDEFHNRIKAIEEEKVNLMASIKHLETAHSQDLHMRARLEQDCKDLIKNNVELRAQIDILNDKLVKEADRKDDKKQKSEDQIKEEEQIRNDLSRVKDDFNMVKISLEMKEKRSEELSLQVKALESNLNKVTEARSILTEKITALETRVRNQELEIIQLGQDKW
jgi:chromosome segregation ATPase